MKKLILSSSKRAARAEGDILSYIRRSGDFMSKTYAKVNSQGGELNFEMKVRQNSELETGLIKELSNEIEKSAKHNKIPGLIIGQSLANNGEDLELSLRFSVDANPLTILRVFKPELSVLTRARTFVKDIIEHTEKFLDKRSELGERVINTEPDLTIDENTQTKTNWAEIANAGNNKSGWTRGKADETSTTLSYIDDSK